MVLKLIFCDCFVCGHDLSTAREKADLDEIDEVGGRNQSWFDHPLPPARLRDKIARDLCDLCWKEYREKMILGRYQRGRRYPSPPFNQIYLWDWVATKLRDEAKRRDREARRLHPHLAAKAREVLGVKEAGPRRFYGPRRLKYGHAR